MKNKRGKAFLDYVLPPFHEPKREKPRNMLYIVNETPPWPTTLLAGIQHVLLALMLTVYFAIVGQEVGLSTPEMHGFISMGIVIMGIGTILNGLTTRISPGHLLTLTPNYVVMTAFIAVTLIFGQGAAAGGLLVGGIAVFVLGRFLSRLQPLFPPIISGVLLMLLGVSLLPNGIERCLGLGLGAPGEINLENGAIAFSTLAGIIIFSVWGSSIFRVLAVGLGVVAGVFIAAVMGHFGLEKIQAVSSQPIISLPLAGYSPPTPEFILGGMLPMIVTMCMSGVANIGGAVMVDKMNNANWRRADLSMAGRLLHTMGICHFLSGLAGTTAVGGMTPGLGLSHATGVSVRRVGVLVGLMLILAAFLPQVSMFMVILPQAVKGAILVYTAAFMMVSGAELITSRMLNNRSRATVGLSLTAGMAVIILPELTYALPKSLEPVLGSGLVVGVSLAMILNFIFRIGISTREEIVLDSDTPAKQAAVFLTNKGMDWGAQQESINRASLTMEEVLETLGSSGRLNGPVTLQARWDEYKLILVLDYPGRRLYLDKSSSVDLGKLLEEEQPEEALDEAMGLVSAKLIHNLADKVSSTERNERAQIRLVFNQ
jgi:xanthine/uracil permease